MTVNWVRLGLATLLFLLVFTTPLGVDAEMARLFKLLEFLFALLMLGLSVGVKGRL